MNILTEREFLTETESTLPQVTNLIDIGVFNPIKLFSDKLVFFRKHVRLILSIKQLESQGLSFEQIAPHIQDETLDVQTVLDNANVTVYNLAYFQSLSYEDLIDRCRAERIVGFRRMTREQMEICLSDPEQREIIVQEIRESNRRRTRPATAEPAAPEVTVTPAPVVTPQDIVLNSDLSNTPYKELVQLAKEQRIPNFRRMTKDELIICFTASDEVVAQLIAHVRERTKNRYGSSASSVQTQPLAQFTFDENYSQLLEEQSQLLEEQPQPFFEETIEDIQVDEDTVVPDSPEEEVAAPEPVAEVLPSPENIVIVPSEELDTSVPADAHTDEVPHSLEELQAMPAKQVACVVRDYLNLKYFRRMTKEELITCIFRPELRPAMVATAAARYELYRGRRYGQNAR